MRSVVEAQRHMSRVAAARDPRSQSVTHRGEEQRRRCRVRGGGHGVAGLAVTDGGLMIDLAPMKTVGAELPIVRLDGRLLAPDEIGAGFGSVVLGGEENGDEMRMQDGKVVFLSNHAGGILGGISSGQDIVVRFAVKPTSSILHPMRTVDSDGNEVEIETHGRHDPCVGIRAVPIGEAMMACVLADHYLMHRAQVGEGTAWPFKPQ